MSKITNSVVFRENIRTKFHPILNLDENAAINLEKGVFNSLFPKDMIAFDTKTGSFKITK